MAISEIRFAPDGKTFVAGGVVQKYDNSSNEYDVERLELYDASTWERKSILVENLWYSVGFHQIQFTSDSKVVAASATYAGYIVNLETRNVKKYMNHPTYGEFFSLLLLENESKFAIYYVNTDIQKSYNVIYNDYKDIKAYQRNGLYLATNNDDKFKIFFYDYDNIGVLSPSTLSIEETTNANLTLIYSENSLILTSSGIESQTAKIIISDLSGKEVYAGSVELKDGNAQVGLKLETGIFLYRIITSNKEFTGKFEVVK